MIFYFDFQIMDVNFTKKLDDPILHIVNHKLEFYYTLKYIEFFFCYIFHEQLYINTKYYKFLGSKFFYYPSIFGKSIFFFD